MGRLWMSLLPSCVLGVTDKEDQRHGIPGFSTLEFSKKVSQGRSALVRIQYHWRLARTCLMRRDKMFPI